MIKRNRIGQNSESNKYFLALAVLLVVIAGFNLFSSFDVNAAVAAKIAEAEEAARPADINIISITDKSCSDCSDINRVIDDVKKQNVNVLEERELDYKSEEARQLISKYGITGVPAAVITGETEKAMPLLPNFEENDDALVLKDMTPPYLDLSTNSVKGLVKATQLVDNECGECGDLKAVTGTLEKSGVFFKSERTVQYNSKEGRDLIEKYSIVDIPALVISKEIEDYPNLLATVKQIANKKSDGSYALHKTAPPYIDLSTNNIVGLVKITFLTDESCTECYSVYAHRAILRRYGVAISEEKTVDVSDPEGKRLVEKYNIENAPIIIMSKDVSAYEQLAGIWEQVGTVEDDGTYVFRNPGVMGTYRDLTSGKVISK